METNRINTNGASQKKGGKDSTQVILTAAGATILGAGGAVAATQMLDNAPDADYDEEEELEVETPHRQVNNEPDTHTDANQQQAQAAQHTQQQPTANYNEVQPVDNGTTSATQTTTTQQGGNHTAANDNPTLNDVDPDQIAQEITAVEVDPNDVDLADAIQVDSVDTMYFEDGSEMQVASVHTPDGGDYMMVDVDNDLTFDIITDLEGNPVVAVDGNMTLSDVEDMMDDSGNELAYNPEQNERELAYGGDPDEGIVDTEQMGIDTGEADLMAMNDGMDDVMIDEL